MSKRAQEQALLNRLWSQLILEELVRFGVTQVCIAPGSRSTPLTLEAEMHSALTIHTHFDERGLGFLALGMAKAGKAPVAIVVTSGTAVANLLPAIAEAKLTGEKLVVLTADRPPELINCGANQAIEQPGIFSSHVTSSLNLPCPELSVSPGWLLTSLDQVLYAQKQSGSAVHINCPFPEPLYTNQNKEELARYLTPVHKWLEEQSPYTHQLISPVMDKVALPDEFIDKKTIVIAGKLELHEAQAVKAFAHAMGFPLLCDPQAGISSDWAHYDLWLQADQFRDALAEGDLIIQFGARIVSKRLNAFIRQQCENGECGYWLISLENRRLNPDHLPQIHMVSEVTSWLRQQNHQGKRGNYSGWADTLKTVSKQVQYLQQQEAALTELNLAGCLAGIVGEHDLFIGNSLIVRLVDMVSSLRGNRVFTNRGASGIDGLIATAAGAQRITRSPLLVLVGDTSLLYDINSLALLSKVSEPVVVLVTNNDGGAIFDLLPVPEEQKQRLYQMPHGFTFEFAARQFGLEYVLPDSLAALQSQVTEHLAGGTGALVVEVMTPPSQAAEEIKQRVQQIHALR
ncbi:2-succinyl-5-enolpyruvyl-6-hydroxy-3-cyclohexene-1-carboxylic-acid synthase [Vibrio albus]|uniref:2-succinyl-5-enolpyruvyl-6-hydroxy-3-cyclohexene-1-carboxylate synthase n=1 Tax=Vibrio albus TaxID=2200953 RepID=A0A2U3BBY1_9VIBR|nr:2-succinyl-5-enolpyruvyl-6-hydroxy-3-cyclohexene-1-carboxylic-acid synthase [Vibrio albus]PWI34288.1 2-succinyl-5-enolpyruvyl-6-hydroxy-3-cyclohexene-1-carboxylic-acid synthase [Vibrio albus]